MIRLLRAAAALAALIPAAWPAATEAGSPIDHVIEVRLDPESGRLEAADMMTLSGRDEVSFHLASWLEIDRILADGRPANATNTAGKWHISLTGKGHHEVELRFRGVVAPLQPEQWSRMDAASGPEGGYLLGHGAWIPTTDDDRIAYRLTVEVPAPYRAVASGGLEGEAIGKATYRAVFSASYPAEPPSLFVGPYEVRERREGNIRVRTYFHPELADLAEGYLRDAARYLARFQQRIGPYPFRDFHIVSSPLPVGLGFSNLTYISRAVLPFPFIRERSLAHEALHNWWGNGVAVDYASGNWSEGLTTYMADYALEAERDAAQAREMRLGWLRDYAALPADRDVAVTAFTAKHHDAAQVVGYNKVAFIFHMLEREIGEDAFIEGIRLFWRRHKFRVAGWAELRQAFEEASGQDLAWFFEQWLRRAGAPRLSLGAVETWPEGDGYRVRLTVRQGRPAYRLTIPVAIDTVGRPERQQIVLEGVEGTTTLTANARPTAIHIDPDYDLFRRLLPEEAPPILRDVTLAANAVTTIATEDDAVDRIAGQLAERLLDTPVRSGAADPSAPQSRPLLLIGTTPEVETFLTRAGLEGMPDNIRGRGTARVWAVRRPNGQPLLVAAADDAEALQALLRPLPHYGRKSYLVFDGRRAVETGIWAATESPLSRRLDQ